MIICCTPQNTERQIYQVFAKNKNSLEIQILMPFIELSGKEEDLRTLLQYLLSREPSRQNPIPASANTNLDPDLEHASILIRIIDSDRLKR